MKCDAYVELESIAHSDRFNEVINETESLIADQFHFRKWSVYKLEKYALGNAAVYLADYIEANAEEEDFDEDGKLKPTSFHPDEKFSEFLSTIFTVVKAKTEFNVTVTFTLEADSEDDAEQQVENNLSYGGGIDYVVDEVREA